MDEGAPQGPGPLVGGWWGTAATDVMSQLCRVCGEPAAGFHFGAFTCEGCKSFFGRTYNNPGSITECKNQGVCVINKKNRTSCKACRLRKCLAVGMSKSGSRYGRRSNWFKIHCLLQEQQHHHQQQQQQQQQLQQPATPQVFGVPPAAAKSPKSSDPGVGAGRKPEDMLFALWAGGPPPPTAAPPLPAALMHPPPPHLSLPFLGTPYLPAFNGAPPLFPIASRPEWSAAVAARLAGPPPLTSPPPTPIRRPLPRSVLATPKRPSSLTPPPRLSASPDDSRPPAPVQEQPMDLSKAALVPPAHGEVTVDAPLEPIENHKLTDEADRKVITHEDDDLLGDGGDKDEGSDSGVSERESDRAGEGEGEADSPIAVGVRPPLVVPSPLDLSSRA